MTYSWRNTDTEAATHPRKERLFLRSGLWYFRTREGEPIGPFRYRQEAEAMLARFLTRLRENEIRQHTRVVRPKPRFRARPMR